MLKLEEKEELGAFLEELMEFIEEKEIEEMELDQEEVTIKDIKQANYYVKKIKEMQKEQEEIKVTAAAAIKDYQQKVALWEQERLSTIEKSMEYLANILEPFVRTQLEGSTKRSLKLIEGTVGYRAQQPQIEYEDEVLLDFLKDNAPEYINYKPLPMKKELKENAKIKNNKLYLKNKIVDGVSVTERGDKFYIK